MKKYYSVDLELSGKNVGKHSILSIGACIVGERGKQFYRELKPLSFEHSERAMRAGSMGLQCLTPKLRKSSNYDPEHRFFRPDLVLKLLYKEGFSPEEAMKELLGWIDQTRDQAEPILLAKPIIVDIPFIHWYAKKYCGGLGCLSEDGIEDLEESYRSLVNRKDASVKELNVMDNRAELHNALDDAVYQAEQFEKIIEIKENMADDGEQNPMP